MYHKLEEAIIAIYEKFLAVTIEQIMGYTVYFICPEITWIRATASLACQLLLNIAFKHVGSSDLENIELFRYTKHRAPPLYKT